MQTKTHQLSLDNFRQYLVQKEMRASTIQEHVNCTRRYLQWITESERAGLPGSEHQQAGQITYTELLEYVQYLKSRNVQIPTINMRLAGIRHYYEFLKSEGLCETNPARSLFIKGTVKRVVVNPLTYPELEKLYHDYAQYAEAKPTYNSLHRASIARGKAMLSLLIWQGLHSGELQKMRREHIDLSKGVIEIQGGARSNARTLSLAPVQILPLNSYLQSLQVATETLFIGDNVNNNLQLLIKEVRGVNPIVKNAGHIRASVILHWLKIYGKRQVQYMIGHRSISSTERYEVQQLDTLTDQLQRHHPFA